MNQALRHRDAAAGAQLQPHYATDDDLRQVAQQQRRLETLRRTRSASGRLLRAAGEIP